MGKEIRGHWEVNVRRENMSYGEDPEQDLRNEPKTDEQGWKFVAI